MPNTRSEISLENLLPVSPVDPAPACDVPVEAPRGPENVTPTVPYPHTGRLARREPSEEDRRNNAEWAASNLNRGELVDVFTTDTCFLGAKVIRTDSLGVGFVQDGNYHLIPWFRVKEIVAPIHYEREE